MANTKISIDSLSETVMKELNEYADVACDEMKEAVKSASTLVRDQIKATAPDSTVAGFNVLVAVSPFRPGSV